MTAATTPRTAAPGAPLTGYLHQVDVVRLLTFAAVIAVHSTSATTADASVGANAAQVLLHFTRETFFVLSAFVLFHTHYARGLNARRFYRRRASTIVLPYLLWTLVYWSIGLDALPDGHDLHRLLTDVYTGNAKFHLYFLLVSMQLYFVLPVLVALVRRTTGHHRTLLVVAVVYQLLVLSVLHWKNDLGGPWGWVGKYADTLLPTYLGYVVAGALAAVHLPALDAWVRSHGRTVVLLLLAGAVVTEGVYLTSVAAGMAPGLAGEPLQPLLVPWTAVVTLALYALGAAYAQRRAAGGLPRLGRVVAVGSTISFGVYLAHPLVLQFAVPALHLGTRGGVPSPPATVIAWILAASLSTCFVLAVSRTPLSLALTGRHRQRRTQVSGAAA